MTVAEIYDRSLDILGRANVPTPDIDAKAIVSHHLGLERNELFLNRERVLTTAQRSRIERDTVRRARFEPVAYILGYKYFFHDKFLVFRGVLIPRADTEHLIYAVQNTGRTFKNVLDIGTGSGAIAVSLSRVFPSASITALDVRLAAARRNIRSLGIRNVRLVRKNFMRPGNSFSGKKFDLIVSNPPYLSKEDMNSLGEDAKRYEPRRAFYGGKDGMDFYRKIAEFAGKHLENDGLIVLETDHKWKQVREIYWKEGFHHIEVFQDYNGLERTLIVSKIPFPH